MNENSLRALRGSICPQELNPRPLSPDAMFLSMILLSILVWQSGFVHASQEPVRQGGDEHQALQAPQHLQSLQGGDLLLGPRSSERRLCPVSADAAGGAVID